jgi:hypothetical protein
VNKRVSQRLSHWHTEATVTLGVGMMVGERLPVRPLDANQGLPGWISLAFAGWVYRRYQETPKEFFARLRAMDRSLLVQQATAFAALAFVMLPILFSAAPRFAA